MVLPKATRHAGMKYAALKEHREIFVAFWESVVTPAVATGSTTVDMAVKWILITRT
jgi:hypothetical protein